MLLCYLSSLRRIFRKKDMDGEQRGQQGGILVARALKHQGFWLTLTYVGLILLMARVYA